MASRSLGTLTLDLVAKIGGFVAGMTKAEREADKRLRNIERRASKFGGVLKSALAGFVGAFSVQQIVQGFNTVVDSMDAIRDASIRLGVSTETLSALGYAAKQTGTDIEGLSRGLKILAKNAADAMKEGSAKDTLFDSIGVAVKDAEGNLKSLEVLIPEIADAFAQLEDGTTKAALAQELFGKSGLDLIEFLNQGGAGIEALMQKAEDLGLVLSQDAADSADEFNDELNNLYGAIQGLAMGVAEDLLPELTEMVKWATEWVTDGDNAKETTEEITKAFSDMAEVIRTIGSVVGFFDDVKDKLNEIQQFLIEWTPGTAIRKKIQEAIWGRSGDWDLGGFVDNPSGAPVQQTFNPTAFGPQFQIPGVRQPFSAVPTGRDFTKFVSASKGIDINALNKAISGDIDKGGGGKKGKSDAERQAEKIAEAIRDMTEAQREWQAELDTTGNRIADDYAKRLAEITKQAEEFARDGVPTDKIATFRSEMEKLAEAFREKETIAYLEEFSRATEDMVLSATGASTASVEYTRSIEELNKELEKGIITQDLYNERAAAYAQIRDASANQVLADIQMQRDMLGQTAEYQDTYNKLIAAGVTANSEFGQAIIAANAELHNQATAVQAQVDMMDAFRDSVKGLFQDVKDGASVWDALKDAVDRFADSLFNIILNNLVQRAFGEYGSASGGSSGGWLATAASLIFGGATGASTGGSFVGPRAIGGQVSRGMLYEVNENSAEVLSMGGRDYLMMGGANGQVHAEPVEIASSNGDVNIQFLLNGRPDPRTQAQIAAKVGFETQRAMKRNGR